MLEDIDEVETEIIEAEDTAAEIIERSEAHDVTVLGAPIKSALRRILFGSTPDAVGQQASGTVLVKKGGARHRRSTPDGNAQSDRARRSLTSDRR